VRVEGVIDGATLGGEALVDLPAGYGGVPGRRHPLVVALHGWGHTPVKLRDEGGLGPLADRVGAVVVVPAMVKSVYESAFYPEGRATGAPAPGLRWVGEVVVPWARRSYAVADTRDQTALIGYSTGGRGAVLVAERYPDLVAFAASLSGTYDLMALPPSLGEHKIHARVFGARARFAERWRKDDVVTADNLTRLEGRVWLFIGHGAADRVVPVDQVDRLRAALAKRPVRVTWTVREGLGHDWDYWRSAWPGVFTQMRESFEGVVP
jgi:S-formylglutathione hydrolase FrmB